MFNYPVNKSLLEEIYKAEDQELWETVNYYIQENKIQYQGTSSIFCRLLDCQREGQLDLKLDVDSLDYKYLPQTKKMLKEFVYNGQIKQLNQKLETLQKFIPENQHKLDFNKIIVDQVMGIFKINNFNFDFN